MRSATTPANAASEAAALSARPPPKTPPPSAPPQAQQHLVDRPDAEWCGYTPGLVNREFSQVAISSMESISSDATASMKSYSASMSVVFQYPFFA